MAKTKTTPRRGAIPIVIPMPQNTLNITDRVRDRQTTDAIAKSTQLKIVNRTKKPSFKIKKLLPEPKTVQIRKNGQAIKNINVHRKSYYFNGTKTNQY